MLVINNSVDFQQQGMDNHFLTKLPITKEFAKIEPNYYEKEDFEQCEDNDETSTDYNFSVKNYKQGQQSPSNSNQNIDYELLRIKCQEKVDFASRMKQINSMNIDISYKVQMLQALKQQLQEKLADQTSFRHLMRKQVSKKQKQNSSTFTKTTAAHSIASTTNNNNNHLNINVNSTNTHSPISLNPHNLQLSISNNPQLANLLTAAIQQNQDDNLVSKRCSIFSVQTQVLYSGRKDGQSPFNYKFDNSQRMIENPSRRRDCKQDLIQQCKSEEVAIKNIEKTLIPVKNERNRISEILEDYKDDLIVNKQYLRDITNTYDQKIIHAEQLIKKITLMSRSGYTMNNRENNTANMSMLNTTRMNATFVEEAVSKFKAVKDFFKTKLFQSRDTSNQGQLFGSMTSRNGNSQNTQPMTNRILDFN